MSTTMLDPVRSGGTPRITNGLTRRGLLTGAGAIGVLTVLPGSAWAQATGEAAPGAFPVTIEHAYGSTEIGEEPRRVVSVGYNDQDPIVALGVIPVGVMEWYYNQPTGFFWVTERYGDTPPETVNGADLEINFEKVAALRPDLIVGVSGLEEDDYQTLSRIAPTLAQPPGEGRYSSAPWQVSQRMIGRALGRADRAEQLIAEVEAQIAAVREEHPEFAGSSAVVGGNEAGVIAIRGSSEVWSEFLTDLGFQFGDIADEDYKEISEEQLELLGDLDVVVWLSEPGGIQDSPLYQGLDVALEGRDVFVDAYGEVSGTIGFNSALSLPIAIQRLVPQLAAAIDGDPATTTEVLS
ncbi:MAG: iron-siderophore ABC transporter substrate-binding protein [Egibacteraceae bacterium]